MSKEFIKSCVEKSAIKLNEAVQNNDLSTVKFYFTQSPDAVVITILAKLEPGTSRTGPQAHFNHFYYTQAMQINSDPDCVWYRAYKVDLSKDDGYNPDKIYIVQVNKKDRFFPAEKSKQWSELASAVSAVPMPIADGKLWQVGDRTFLITPYDSAVGMIPLFSREGKQALRDLDSIQRMKLVQSLIQQVSKLHSKNIKILDWALAWNKICFSPALSKIFLLNPFNYSPSSHSLKVLLDANQGNMPSDFSVLFNYPPECVVSRLWVAQSDIYLLGALMLHLLDGGDEGFNVQASKMHTKDQLVEQADKEYPQGRSDKANFLLQNLERVYQTSFNPLSLGSDPTSAEVLLMLFIQRMVDPDPTKRPSMDDVEHFFTILDNLLSYKSSFELKISQLEGGQLSSRGSLEEKRLKLADLQAKSSRSKEEDDEIATLDEEIRALAVGNENIANEIGEIRTKLESRRVGEYLDGCGHELYRIVFREKCPERGLEFIKELITMPSCGSETGCDLALRLVDDHAFLNKLYAFFDNRILSIMKDIDNGLSWLFKAQKEQTRDWLLIYTQLNDIRALTTSNLEAIQDDAGLLEHVYRLCHMRHRGSQVDSRGGYDKAIFKADDKDEDDPTPVYCTADFIDKLINTLFLQPRQRWLLQIKVQELSIPQDLTTRTEYIIPDQYMTGKVFHWLNDNIDIIDAEGVFSKKFLEGVLATLEHKLLEDVVSHCNSHIETAWPNGRPRLMNGAYDAFVSFRESLSQGSKGLLLRLPKVSADNTVSGWAVDELKTIGIFASHNGPGRGSPASGAGAAAAGSASSSAASSPARTPRRA